LLPGEHVRVLVTRPEPECERTAALLRERGHEALLLPLLRIEPIADAELGAGPWAAVLFTSANAVRSVAAHRRFGELAGLPAYTVGRRTKAAAVAAGFVSVTSADGDVNALVRLVISAPPAADRRPPPANRMDARFSPPPCGEGSGVGVVSGGTALPQSPDPPPHPTRTRGDGVAAPRPQLKLALSNHPLLYCAGEDRAGDLAGALQVLGLAVETALVYRAIMVDDLPPDVRAAFVSGRIDAVLHYSARTAAAFVAATARAGIEDLSTQVRHLCLSAQVAAPLAAAGANAIEVASEPNEQTLLALIGRT
jgi:uroporphyrinogen-III synthase